MKQSILFLFIILSSITFSQRPIRWEYNYDAANECIVFTAKLDKGWHLYSQKIGLNLGPVPTLFSFNENKLIKFKGRVKEPESLSEFDPNFGAELQYFENTVSFRQKIRSKNATSISGSITYMVCNATSCLPPIDEVFEIQLN